MNENLYIRIELNRHLHLNNEESIIFFKFNDVSAHDLLEGQMDEEKLHFLYLESFLIPAETATEHFFS